MDLWPHRFLVTWAVGFISVLAALAVFNAAVDPYLMFNTRRISGFNDQKSPGEFTQELMTKAYDALRETRRTLVFGSSVVDWGLDTRDPAWPAGVRPIYNFGIPGSGPRLAYLQLRYVLSRQHPDLVVLGLDFATFLTVVSKVPQFFEPAVEARLITSRDGSAIRARQRVLDTLLASISLDATLDSISTVSASINIDPPNAPVPDRDHIPASDLWMIKTYEKAQMDSTVMPFVRAFLDLCMRHGINVIVLIDPTHADALEIFDRLGFWQTYEDWKRELVKLTSGYNGPEGLYRVRLWDFSGYNANTIGIAKSRTPSQPEGLWFDNLHHTQALGNLELRRIFANEEMGFGVLLDRANVEAHIQEIRRQQQVYRRAYRSDANRVLKILEDAHHFHW